MSIGSNGGPPLRDSGWYATHRDMLSHPLVGICKPVKPDDPRRGSASRFEAWHWLISNAAYRATAINNAGTVMDLQPGQVMGARSYLAREWNWTEKTVRVFLKQLLVEHMITLATDAIRGQQRANTANIITLCNYLKYQIAESELEQTEGPAKGQQRASEGPQSNKLTTLSDISNEISSPGSDEPAPVDDPFDARSFNRKVVDTAFAEYLALAKRVGLPSVRQASLRHYREDMIRRMREHATDGRSGDAMLAVWRQALTAIEISAFCQGENDRGWKADLGFMCQKKSFLKLVTGSFGNGAHARSAAKPRPVKLIDGPDIYERLSADGYDVRRAPE